MGLCSLAHAALQASGLREGSGLIADTSVAEELMLDPEHHSPASIRVPQA